MRILQGGFWNGIVRIGWFTDRDIERWQHRPAVRTL
jgi:hypothetical protein